MASARPVMRSGFLVFAVDADQHILETTILEVMFVLQRSGVTNVAFEILQAFVLLWAELAVGVFTSLGS
ncbi:MAG: hypothetical protein AAFR91_11605 [Pseudomonadota bacterium]